MREMDTRLCTGHGSGDAGVAVVSAPDGESKVEQIFLLAPGPPNSQATIRQDGASNPVSGDTWFPVVLASEGRKGCTFVLEEIQWFLSQQAPQITWYLRNIPMSVSRKTEQNKPSPPERQEMWSAFFEHRGR